RHEVERVRLDERLGAERAALAELEAQLEAAREQRAQWQVDAAQAEARLAAARERAARATDEADDARHESAALADEMAALERESSTLDARRAEWEDALRERRAARGCAARSGRWPFRYSTCACVVIRLISLSLLICMSWFVQFLYLLLLN